MSGAGGARGRGGYAAKAGGAFLPGRGKGRGKGKGKGGIAAGAGAAQSGALAALSAICAYDPNEQVVFAVPELQVGRAVVDCCVYSRNTALLFAEGDVLSHGSNCYGLLGAGDCQPREAAVAARLPWPAALVRFGTDFAVALRCGGTAVCSWGEAHYGALGRPTAAEAHGTPTEVAGLPPGDPVTLLDVGHYFVIAVTQGGEVYGWGWNWGGQLGLPLDIGEQPTPRRIAALCGRGLCRLSCGVSFTIAETRSGELLWWGLHKPPAPLLPREGRILHPLRCLSGRDMGAAAADAAGRLWCCWKDVLQLAPAGLPSGELVTHAAVCVARGETVVLAATARGRLWDCRAGGSCRSITAPGAAPLGLLPYGGHSAYHAILIPDPSCGLRRCRLLLLAAGRCELLPGGQMRRAALVPFLVGEEFIFEEQPDADGAAEEHTDE